MLQNPVKTIPTLTLTLSLLALSTVSCSSSKSSSSSPRSVPAQAANKNQSEANATNKKPQEAHESNNQSGQTKSVSESEETTTQAQEPATLQVQEAQFAATSRGQIRELILSKLAQMTAAERSAQQAFVKSIEAIGSRVGNTQHLTTVTLSINGRLISLAGTLKDDRVASLRSNSDLYGYFTCLDQSPSTCFEQLIELRSNRLGKSAVFVHVRRMNADFEFESRLYKNAELQKLNEILLNTEAGVTSAKALKTIVIQTTEIIGGPSHIEILLLQRSGGAIALHAPLYVASNDSTGLSLTQMEPLGNSSLLSDLTQQGTRLYLNHRLTAQLVRFQADAFVELNLQALEFNNKERGEQLPLLLKLKPQATRALRLKE